MRPAQSPFETPYSSDPQSPAIIGKPPLKHSSTSDKQKLNLMMPSHNVPTFKKTGILTSFNEDSVHISEAFENSFSETSKSKTPHPNSKSAHKPYPKPNFSQ